MMKAAISGFILLKVENDMEDREGVMRSGEKFHQAPTRGISQWCPDGSETPTRREARQVIAIASWVVCFFILQEAAIQDALAYRLQIFAMVFFSVFTVFNRSVGCYLVGIGGSALICLSLFPMDLETADYCASGIVLAFSLFFLFYGGVIGMAGWAAVSGINIACSLLGWVSIPMDIVGVCVWCGSFFSAYSAYRAKISHLKRIESKRKKFYEKINNREQEVLNATHDLSNAFNGAVYAASNFCKKSEDEKQTVLERCTTNFATAKRKLVGNRCVTILEAMRRLVYGETGDAK
jgi:hypothetical protein